MVQPFMRVTHVLQFAALPSRPILKHSGYYVRYELINKR